MSMNLCFDIKGCKHGTVDFPYPTRGDLAFSVLNEKDLEKRIQLVKDDLERKRKSYIKREEEDILDGLINACEALMRVECLELSAM